MLILRSALCCFVVFAFLSAPAAGQDKPKPPPPKEKPKPLAPGLAKLLQGSPEEFLQRFDMNKDGVLSPDELPPRVAELFDRADANKDGKLDKQETAALLAVLRKQLGQPQPPPNAQQVDQVVQKFLERLDANKDGKVSKDEAMGPLAQNFDQIDANKDGFLDRDELRTIAAKFVTAGAPGKPRLPEPAVPIPDFDAHDQNADGRLTPDEVKGTPFAGQFAAMDANKDGKVDRKEFEAFFRKQAAKKEPNK